MSEGFQLIEEAMAIFHEDDLRRDRSSQVAGLVADAMNCYKDLYQQKKRKSIKQSLDK